MDEIQVVTPHFVTLSISTSENVGVFGEKTFPKDITIGNLKTKLDMITGGNYKTMQLQVYDKEDKLICSLTADDRLLGSYPVDSHMRLHVIDKFIMRDEFERGDVPKFELSNEKYDQMPDSVKAFMMKNKLGHYHEDHVKKQEQVELMEKQLAENLVLNSRCKVELKNASPRLGSIRYVGPVESLQGLWVGVQYDEPLGKNNGSLKGKQYFECPDKYGAFVKPQTVVMGDFPEEDYDLLDEI